MRGQRGRCVARSEAAATVRSRGPSGRASIRAADDVLEADLQSDEIVACFEEALGERQPEMGMDAAAGREANAESAEAAPRLEAAAEQQREHSPLAPTAGRGVEPVLPDPVPMLHTNSGGPVLHKIRSNEETEDGTDRASQMPAKAATKELPSKRAPKQKSS